MQKTSAPSGIPVNSGPARGADVFSYYSSEIFMADLQKAFIYYHIPKNSS